MPDSPKVGFPLLTGGSDYPTPDDPADAKDINVALLALEDELGIRFATSGTRPSTPYTNQLIYETNTGRIMAWDGNSWEQVSGVESWGRATNNGEQTIQNNNDTKATLSGSSQSGITFGSNEFTIVNTGRYNVVGGGRWQTSGAGYRWMEIRVDGAIITPPVRTVFQPPAGVEAAGQAACLALALSAGDKVSLWVQHNVGEAIELRGAYLSLNRIA